MTTPKKPAAETIEVVDGEVEVVAEKPRMKRRDLIDASRLLQRHKMDPTNPAELSLAVEFLSERRAGDTKASFQMWLDEEIEDEEEEDEGAGDIDDLDAPDPMEPS